MLRQFAAELKGYNFYEEFRKDYYIDAYDEHKWKVGRIKNIIKYGTRTTVQVHFDGYSVRFDENYDIPSLHKLAPLRTYTLPYTGHPQFEPKRDESEISNTSHLFKQLQKFIKGEKGNEKIKASAINQFLRGQLFIAADYYACKRSYQRKQDIQQSLDFLVNYVKECSKILHLSVEFLKQIQKQNSLDTNLFTVHPKVALLLSNTEFLFVLNTLVGNKDQRGEIHKLLPKLTGKNEDICEMFRALVLDNKILESCQKIMNFKTTNGRGLPWSLKKEVSILFKFTKQGYIFPMPTDHRDLIEILEYMNYFSTKGLLTKEEEEKKSLEFIVNLIINGNFEGRLRGLNQLKKILDFSALRKKDNILEELKNRDLLNFLIDNKNFNPELFKRSIPVFQFCNKNNLLNQKHLSQILSLHRDKHQLQIKSFYSSLAQFPSFLEPEVVRAFLKEITQSCPLNDFLIVLVKEYTITALTKCSLYKKAYCKEGYELGLSFYWSLITSEASGLPYQLKIKVVQAFAAIIGDLYYEKQVEKYMSLAIKGIANRKNLQFYFKVIHETLKLSKFNRIAKSIEAVEKEVNIVDCVIDGLKSGQHLTQNLWECMFQFLQEVTYASKKKFSYSQAREFWKIKECRKYFLKFLRKYRIKRQQDKSQQKIINKQLSMQVIREVVEKIFLDYKEMQQYMAVTSELYQTADELIIAYNHQHKIIEYNFKHTIRTRNIEKIFGLDFYCNVINCCKETQIVEKAIHRLVQLGARIPDSSKAFESVKIANWTYILEKLSKLKRNVLLGYKIMLEDIKGRMKSLNILDPDSIAIVVLNRASGEKRTITVPRYTSLWKLRHVIGQEFGLEGLGFQMSTLSSHSYKESFFEREEDYSVMLISYVKDQVPVIITPNNKAPKHPHLESLQNFSKTISDLKGEELFERLGKEEGAQALEILEKIPLVKKLVQKVTGSFKDPNQVLDSSSFYKLQYQLKILNSQKNLKHTISLIDKGFINHVAKIFINKKMHVSAQSYNVLGMLMSYFNEMLKFIKMAKTPQTFNEGFLIELLHYNPKQIPEYISYLIKCFQMIKDLANNKDFLQLSKIRIGAIFQHSGFEKVLEAVLLSKNREKVSEIILDLARLCNSEQHLHQILNRLLNFQTLKNKQRQCRHLFDMVAFFIDKKMPGFLLETIKKLLRDIRKYNIVEESEDDQNQLLSGYVHLLLKITKIASRENIEQFLGDKYENFANYIVNDCLINVEQPNNIRFKSQSSRAEGYALLQQLDFNLAGGKFALVLNKAMRGGCSWRKYEQWNVSPVKQVTHTYTGLKNLAATCYINSLLQQLFFIESFSSQLLALDADKIEDKENIVQQLQNIFSHLKFSQSPIYTTSSFCKRFIYEGQPIDPRVQTDVDQFFHSLIDKVERNLSKINRKDIITNLFGGEQANLIVGAKCEHTSERIQPFLSIRLQIKDKKNLEEAFKEFIKGEVLQGDNAYFCERCDTKVKAVKRVCLKTLPEVLILTLKRFEFDYETMQKFKLNTYCSFPQLLNVLPFTREGIDNEKVDKSNYEYRLKGVVIHYGISEAGHYTSYIQTQDKKWHYFDDERITDFNVANLGNQSYGGIEENPFGDDEQKKKNAYLLFYEKVKKSDQVKSIPLSTLRETPVYKAINDQNMKNKLLNLLFESNIQNYILQMVNNNKIEAKTFLFYFHLVFLRSARKRQKMELFYNFAQNIIKKGKDAAEWYLSQINENFLSQFLFYIEPELRYITVGLIVEAFKVNTNIQVGKSVLQQIGFFIGKRNMYPAPKIFANAIKVHKAYEKHLKEIGLPDIVISVIKSKDPKGTNKLEASLKKTENEFGYCPCIFAQRNLLDCIDFLQAVQGLKCGLSEEDIDLSLIKRLRKIRTQQSLGIIIARKGIQLEGFSKLTAILTEALVKMELHPQDDFIFWFYIHLVEQLARIQDQLTSRRIQELVTIYLVAIRESLQGYKAQLVLLLGLFRICSSNPQFRDRVSDEFQEKDNKKLLKDIRGWIKDVGGSFSHYIRQDKIGYWRKPRQLNISYQSLISMLEAEDQISIDKFQSSLNAIVEKHNSFLKVGVEETWSRDERVKYLREEYKFFKNYGLTAELLTKDDKIKLVPVDEVVKMEYY